MRTLAKLSVLLVAAVLVFGSRAQATSSLQVVFQVTIDGYNSIAWEDGTTNPINLTIHNPAVGAQLQFDCVTPGVLKKVKNTSEHNTTSIISASHSATGLSLNEVAGPPLQIPDQWGAASSFEVSPMVLNPGQVGDWQITIFTPVQVTHNHTGTITITVTATAQ